MIAPGFPGGCVASLAGRQSCRVTVVSFPVGVSSGVDAGNAYSAAYHVLCALGVRVYRTALCVATGDDSVGAAAGRKETDHR